MITIVLIKVTNENEVEKFTNDFENFFNDLAKTNEAPKKEENTEIENRKFYFVFIAENDINYTKSLNGMNNENILKCFYSEQRDAGYSYTFTFYKPIKIADLGKAIYLICKSIYPEKYISKNCCCNCCDICNIM